MQMWRYLTMTILSFILLSLFPSFQIKDVVEQFHRLETKDSEIAFSNTYQGSFDPSILAFVCAVEMKQVEYLYNPYKKLKIFHKTKQRLNLLIQRNPTNIYLRYVRLLLQEKTPRFLGYNENIQEDKKFLQRQMNIKDESDYLDRYIHKNTSL